MNFKMTEITRELSPSHKGKREVVAELGGPQGSLLLLVSQCYLHFCLLDSESLDLFGAVGKVVIHRHGIVRN